VLDYTAPIRDIAFSLDLVGAGELATYEAFAHADADTVTSLLEEFGKLSGQVISPTNEIGDRVGLKVDTKAATITTPPEFKTAYKAYVDGGWGSVPLDATYGGGGFPHVVGLAMSEMLQSANMALALCPMLTQGSIEALSHWGSEIQKETYLPKLVSGEWTGTMNLTEPDAGSDVGALRTKAVQATDGTWRITGQKIYITWGEHDLTDNIIHLVLARVEGAPTGTKGISCFIVPKFLLNADGSLGARNDVKVVSTEHKMGIHGSPTCVLAFGDDGEGAIGELIGEVNTGMRTMFTMMNNARLAVGQQGQALAERAYQLAYAHATSRVQGRVAGSTEAGLAIIGHADVRRMLMTMRSQIEAMRHLIYLNGKAIDDSRYALTPEARSAATELADLLTPMSKAWCTDLGNEVCSLGVQIFGGMGFCEDTGAAQLYRDVRIAAIYEGTNGIQALDLFGRKLPMRDGAVVRELIETMRNDLKTLDGGSLSTLREDLSAGIDALEQAVRWMLSAGRAEILDGMSGATPFLRLFATVVGGWLMARQAVEATKAGIDDTYNAAKVATAEFFLDQILPTGTALLSQVTATAKPLYVISNEALTSC
jgi:3-(methylthio)propanoyl-CoA dehydrogenase